MDNVALHIRLGGKAFGALSASGWQEPDSYMGVIDKIAERSQGRLTVHVTDAYPTHICAEVVQHARSLRQQLLIVPCGNTAESSAFDRTIVGPLKSRGRKKFRRMRLLYPDRKPTLADAVKCAVESWQSIPPALFQQGFGDAMGIVPKNHSPNWTPASLRPKSKNRILHPLTDASGLWCM